MAKWTSVAGYFAVCILIIFSFFTLKQWIELRPVQINTTVSNASRRVLCIDPNKTQDQLPRSDFRIPQDAELGRMGETQLMKIYLKYINRLQILCKDVIRVGSLKDGGKEICVDNGYKPKAPCLVYSFGINNQFDFDEAVVDFFGCDVHCFDPSMKTETHRMSEHIWFYNWGLGGTNRTNGKNWDIKTLDTIRRELGHTNRTIDILKIDIEGDEWRAIPQMISSGALNDVRQISMETHFVVKRDNRQRRQLSALRQLYDFGYRIFMRERNLCCVKKLPGIKGSITNTNEVSMIKPF